MSQSATLGPIAETAPSRNRPPLIEVEGLNLWYGDQQALFDVAFDLFPNEIMAFIGPSGCGKTTALKCLNRMHDDMRGVRIEGLIRMNGEDIHRPEVDPPLHRRRFGWVAQKPNPFPMSVYDNIAYGAALQGLVDGSGETDAVVEACLRQVRLWDEVKDDLHGVSGLELSGGQQQRLCIARALSTRPEVLLMDEPTGSIDPIATAAIEELIVELKESCAIVLITHSMMEARRIADRVAFFDLGRLVEIGRTEDVFSQPRSPRCAEFILGRIG